MFRPIRTIMLVLFAFVAGVLFEKSGQNELCSDRGGEMSEGLCLGVDE